MHPPTLLQVSSSQDTHRDHWHGRVWPRESKWQMQGWPEPWASRLMQLFGPRWALVRWSPTFLHQRLVLL